ncbi:MAG: LTA synthase family protein [Gammaproteobacteria bacterium]|nr:LTA synthase family protein [Gammaproteobacteria bacterium]
MTLPDVSGPAESSVAAMDALTRNMTTTSARPTFKFFHVMSMHSPITMNAACQSIGEQDLSRDSYVAQARCAVRELTEILAALREHEIYDNTTIVVVADHGASIRGNPPRSRFLGQVQASAGGTGGRFAPLYLVKPPRANGPLQLSARLRRTQTSVQRCATSPSPAKRRHRARVLSRLRLTRTGSERSSITAHGYTATQASTMNCPRTASSHSLSVRSRQRSDRLMTRPAGKKSMPPPSAERTSLSARPPRRCGRWRPVSGAPGRPLAARPRRRRSGTRSWA